MKWWLICMTLVGGGCVGFQAAVNGVLGRRIGVLETSFFSFFIGTLILGVLVLSVGRGQFSEISKVPLWYLTGGFLGAAYIFILVYTVPKIGVSAFSLTTRGCLGSASRWIQLVSSLLQCWEAASTFSIKSEVTCLKRLKQLEKRDFSFSDD